jgi:hypothetical protein
MRTLFAAFVATPVLALATTLLLASCRFLGGERVHGNGNVITGQRNVKGFNSIEAGGAVEVHVRQDPATSVKVETDENLFEYLDVYTEGNTLIIKPKQGYNLDPSDEVRVFVTAPVFKSIDGSGAVKIIGDSEISGSDLELSASGASEMAMNVKVSKLRADLSGASNLELKGSSSNVSTQASGASHIRCRDLETDETTLDLSGASSAEVYANKQLNIEASGASDVKYRGNASVNQKSSGASSVEKE